MDQTLPHVGDTAPSAILALPIPLPSLVLWLRHVGWRFFAEPLAQLRELEPDFAALGVNVRCITIGSQEKAAEYCARHNPAATCIGDATMHTYKAMGLDDFDLSTLKTNAALVRRRDENDAAGFVQDWDATRIEDAAQNPGAALIDAAGVLRYIHRGVHPGDMPPLAELLETVRALA